jgi:hypothetical protein
VTLEQWFYLALIAGLTIATALTWHEMRQCRRAEREWSDYLKANGVTRLKSGRASREHAPLAPRSGLTANRFGGRDV